MHHARSKVFLNVGDFHFAGRQTHIHTLLGSCVSVTVWHPQLLVGGMCHFALPERLSERHSGLDGRYGNDCLKLFQRAISKRKLSPADFEAKIFGGGNMLNKEPGNDITDSETQTIGDRNVEAAFQLVMQLGCDLQVAHVGEFGYRRIIFDIATGDVWVKFRDARKSDKDLTILTGRN